MPHAASKASAMDACSDRSEAPLLDVLIGLCERLRRIAHITIASRKDMVSYLVERIPKVVRGMHIRYMILDVI